jgi:hypothetical protein
MKTQHTPGPWGVLDEPGHPPLITAWNESDGSTDDIAVVCDETSTTLANAFLIAAAPELLAALQSLTDNAHDALALYGKDIERGTKEDPADILFDLQEALTKAQAAITKATQP